MPTGVNQTIDAQKIAELEIQEQLAGAGAAAANYLDPRETSVSETEPTDSADISGPPANSPQANDAISQNAPSEDDETYLENSDDYNNSVHNGHGASSNSGGDALDAIGEIDDIDTGLEEEVLSFNDEAYMVYDEELGYYVPDAESLERWEQFLITQANILAGLIVVLTSQFEARKIAEEAFTGIPIQENKNSYKDVFARKIRFFQKCTQIAISKLYQRINTENQRLLNERLEASKIQRGDWGGFFTDGDIWSSWDKWWNNFKGMGRDIWNYLSGGDYDKEEASNQLHEYDKYLRAAKEALLQMKEIIKSLVELIKSSFSSGKTSEMARSMISGLVQFNNYLDEIAANVARSQQEVMDQLDELDGDEDKGFWENLGDLFVGLFTGDLNKMLDALIGLTDIVSGWLDYIGLGWIMEPLKWGYELIESIPRIIVDLLDMAFKWCAENLGGFGKIFEGANWLMHTVADGINWVCDKMGDWSGLGSINYFATNQYDFFNVLNYIEENDVTKVIEKYRGEILSGSNAYRAYLSLKLLGADLRNISRQKFTELSGIRNDAELLMQSSESVLGHVTQAFDAILSQAMIAVKAHNENTRVLYSFKQLLEACDYKRIASALTVVVFVLGCIYTAGTASAGAIALAAAICALTAALMNAIASYKAGQVKPFNPLAPSVDDIGEYGKNNIGATAVDVINQIDASERMNIAASAYQRGLITRTQDGYYYLDTAQFSVYEINQKILDNALRSVFSLLKNSKDLRNLASAEFTGSAAADSGEALLSNAVENILLQRQIVQQAIKFQHQEIVTAKNIARQAELAARNAVISGLAQAAGALVGAGIGGAISQSLWTVFMAIGSAVASSLCQLLLTLYDPQTAYGMTIPNSNEILNRMLRSKGGDSVECKLDAAELAALGEMLENGVVGTGDGYHGVNVDVLTEIYSKLGAINAAKDAIAKMRALPSQLRAIVKQEFSGTAGGTSGELTNAVNSASFRTLMRVASNMSRFLQEKVKIMNRARDAEKQFYTALATTIINGVIGIAGAAVAGATNGVTSAVAQTANRIATGMTSSCMALVNAIVSVAMSADAAVSGEGFYNNYDAKTTVDQTGRRINNPNNVDERLDRMEYEVLIEMNSSMIETLNGTSDTVSASSTKLSSRLRALYNIREMLATARSLLSASRNQAKSQFTGKKVGELDFGKEAMSNYEEVASSILDSLKTALYVLVERHNQIAEAKKQSILQAINVGISVANFALSLRSSLLNAEQINMQNSHQAESVQSSQFHMTAGEMQEQVTTLGKISSILNVAGDFLVNLVIDPIYDSVANAKGEKASDPKESHSLDVKSSGHKKGNYFDSVSNMDAAINESQFMLALIEQNSAKHAKIVAQSRKLTESFISQVKGLPSLIHGLQNNESSIYSSGTVSAPTATDRTSIVPTGPIDVRQAQVIATNIMHMDGDEQSSAIQRVAQMPDQHGVRLILDHLQRMSADDPGVQALVSQAIASLQVQPQSEPRPTEFQATDDQPPPSTEALMQYADQIELALSALTEQADQTQSEVEVVAHDVEHASERLSEINDQVTAVESQLSGEREPELPELQAQLADLENQRHALQTQLRGLMTRRRDLEAQLAQLRADNVIQREALQENSRQMSDRLVVISHEIEALGDDPDPARLADLRREQQLLQTRLNATRSIIDNDLLGHREQALSQELAETRTNIKRIRGELRPLQERIGQLQREISRREEDQARQPQSSEVLGEQNGMMSSAWNFASELLGLSRRRAEEDLETVAEQSERPAPGTVDTNVILAMRGAQGGRNFHDQYQRAQQEEDFLAGRANHNGHTGVC